MSFIVETPTGCNNERAYIFGVIFGEWLGLPFKLIQTGCDEVSIRLSETPGEVHLPDIFLPLAARSWLAPESLQNAPLSQWDTRQLAPDILLTDSQVPVLFGDTDPRISNNQNQQGTHIRLPVDIFGSAFFMLSRYEEAVSPERDNHERYPATASLAYRADFLDRPIIDEYVEILWSAMQKLWPNLKRKPHSPRTLVSCDVDAPFAYHGKFKGLARRLVGDLLKRRSPLLAARMLLGEWNAWQGRYDHDPYRMGLDFIMEVNERADRAVAFYFIPENTDARKDNRVSLDQPRMRQLLREIHARGHEIGIHPGYNTYRHPDAMASSVATLRRVLEEERIKQPIMGGRQHYLRWETPTTASLWDENGLDYDSTLGYADRPGFRCGTCREYSLFDPHKHQALRIRERPLIAMECSVIAERYMALGYSDEALRVMQSFREICHRFSGDFGLLWHNSHFSNPEDKQFYQALVT